MLETVVRMIKTLQKSLSLLGLFWLSGCFFVLEIVGTRDPNAGRESPKAWWYTHDPVSFVGGPLSINLDPGGSGTSPHYVSFNSKVYVTWTETVSSSGSQIRMAVFDGNDSSPSWTYLDGGAVTGINKD